MSTEQFILIGALKNRKSYDKLLEKEFAIYKGKYVLANNAEIASTYQDISKYRYIMDYKVVSDFGTAHDYGSSAKIYYIKDRKTNKIYPQQLKSPYYAYQIQSCLRKIDAARKK